MPPEPGGGKAPVGRGLGGGGLWADKPWQGRRQPWAAVDAVGGGVEVDGTKISLVRMEGRGRSSMWWWGGRANQIPEVWIAR